MKTYHAYQAESRQAETKLRVAEQQRSKLEVTNVPPEKLARSKKYKLIEKEVTKVCIPVIIMLNIFYILFNIYVYLVRVNRRRNRIH